MADITQVNGTTGFQEAFEQQADGTHARRVAAAASKDQDPIFDETNGTKTSVTTSATVITPPSGCKYVRIVADAAIVVNTAGGTATDGATAGGAYIAANTPEIIPVVAGTAVTALSLSGTAVVRCTPMKARP